MIPGRPLLLALLTGFSLSVGCQKPFVATQIDYLAANTLAPDLPDDVGPEIEQVAHLEPRTILNPSDLVKWELSLEEARRIALENNQDVLVLGYDPGIEGTYVDERLARFDAEVDLGTGWGRTDEQQNFSVDTIATGSDVIEQDLAGVSAGAPSFLSLGKTNATGGRSQVAYGYDYVLTKPSSDSFAFNPAWYSYVNVSLQQPLLEGAGVEVNRSPVLIARARQERSIRQFESSVQQLVRDVDLQYFQLYFAYQDLYWRGEALKQSLRAWQMELDKKQVGEGALPDSAQARQQYQLFRVDRSDALARVLKEEANLRLLLGLAPEDGRQIVPSDSPTIAEFIPDWNTAVHNALYLRPELVAQRLEIRAAELRLVEVQNRRLPDLSVRADYTITGLSNRLDRSIDVVADNRYQNWSFLIDYRRPIGERAAHAQTRRAQFDLGKAKAELRRRERAVLFELRQAYNDVINGYFILTQREDSSQAAAVSLAALQVYWTEGLTTMFNLLNSRQLLVTAQIDAARSLRDYNQALTRWQSAQGTILQEGNISLFETHLAAARDAKGSKQRAWQWAHSLVWWPPEGKRVHGGPICSPAIPPLFGDVPGPMIEPPPEESAEEPSSLEPRPAIEEGNQERDGRLRPRGDVPVADGSLGQDDVGATR
ncbi:outer membrane channel protein [Planctomycetes bacterium Pan216]|uniref:Outer membrane channel protein n=1 Tax=Kolteria novifilia TaxID=2527975 RepID=A0A518BAG2_9BACT|nr:outer membrane channel protein [Planctomycetes bacterium Pan216]